jgi:HAD superfamily hydrolase (TIGR01490 family)
MVKTTTMKLVLFDLDNTLITGDSDFEWAQFLIGKGVLDREVHEARNLEFYEQYKAGTLDIQAFLDFQLAPLARHPREELDTWHCEFMAANIRPLIGAAARALVQRHLDDDSLVAIVTATNSFVTGPIAKEFGVAHLIATIPAHENGRFTGKPRGTPSFKAGKIERVEDWLEAMGLWWGSVEASWFYSDSLNDLPLMSKVTHPVAVDPDDTLRAHAAGHGWPIISLR